MRVESEVLATSMGYANGDISNYCQTGNVIAALTIIDGLAAAIIGTTDIAGKSSELSPTRPIFVKP